MAYAGIPVTHRDVNQAVTFLSGHDRTGLHLSCKLAKEHCRWLTSHSDVYGDEASPEIAEKLISAGRDLKEPVAIVCNATQANMRVLETNLTDAAHDAEQAEMKPPSIICIGKVTLMRQCLDWMAKHKVLRHVI